MPAKLRGDSTPKGWGIAIAEAERQIKEAEERIKRLRISIDAFRDFEKRGEPFPGQENI